MDGHCRAPRWRWYHGVVWYLLAQMLSFGLSGLTSSMRDSNGQHPKGQGLRARIFGDVSYFESLQQAVVAPPSWVFGPAWTVNNLCAIWGALHVLNQPVGTPGRNAYLALQAATWLDYVVFTTAYFSLRSPINALVLTLCFGILTVGSVLVAIFRLRDSRVALSLATTVVWLLVASTAAVFQALWNHDDFYKVGPLARPAPPWLKKGR